MGVDRTERLLNLVVTLLGSRRPVSRESIRLGVPGYADSASDAAFERMFERDKDELRSMGIPIETVGPDGDIEGYRINRSDYALSIDVTPTEYAVLRLAAAAWDSATSVATAAHAVLKVESAVGEIGVADSAVQFRADTAASSGALTVLLEAVRRRRLVRFAYRKAGGEQAEERTLAPWAVISWRSAWYVVGRDIDRGERRVFRLSRFAGAPTPTGPDEAFEPPADGDYRRVVAEWAQQAEPAGEVVVAVAPTGAATLRARAEATGGSADGEGILRLPYGDPLDALPDVLAAGAAAEVLEPAEVRDEAIRRLRRVLEVHS